MRNPSIAQFILFILLCYAFFILLRLSPKTSINSSDKRWIIYNGFCIRPYLHAGKDVTIRLVSRSSDLNDFLLTSIPRDDPRKFEDDLTLLTHSSASAFDEVYLSKLLANWRGPISLAISLQGSFNEQYVIQKIEATLRLLENKYDASRLSVHIMLEKNDKKTCEESERKLQEKNRSSNIFYASYPINTVRNVARLFSSSRYIAFADSDYLFSSGFYEKILAILQLNVPVGSTNALLYRIFEIEEKDSGLRNHQLTKADLRALIDANRARVFHEKHWPQGHTVPRLTQWLTSTESERPGLFNLNVSLKNRPFWEFQFVGLRDIPMFDENFPYRVDNNLELRWEVCRAGYRLLSVEDLFVYHTLSKNDKGKDSNKRKDAIKRKNYKKTIGVKQAFKKRMDELYPNTKTECPE